MSKMGRKRFRDTVWSSNKLRLELGKLHEKLIEGMEIQIA